MRNMTIEQINSNIEKRQSMVATVKEKNNEIRPRSLGGRMNEHGNGRKPNKIYYNGLPKEGISNGRSLIDTGVTFVSCSVGSGK